jgi:hypothetical protein
MMRSWVLALVFGPLALPAIALADGTPQPKYPPGWDCSAVAAGSQRQARNRSHLDPPIGPIPGTKHTNPTGIVLPQPKPLTLPTVKPPTIPRLPGTIDNGN